MFGRVMCSEQFRGYFYVIRNLSGILRGKVIL
nr:MAG TPA: Non-structural protein 9 binding protein.9A [Caudoviricetes sp.]